MCSDKSYLTPKDVAELLMVSVSAIRLWAERGELKAMVTAGGHRRFQLDDIRQFAKERKIHLNIKADTQIKILVVDDEIIFAEYLQSAIQTSSEDVQVEISLDGFDAGIKLRDFSPNIVILDLMMPGVDGFQVCEKIKQDPMHKDVRVIAMTGNASEENKRKSIDAGAEECLEKPFDMQQLFALLNLNAMPINPN